MASSSPFSGKKIVFSLFTLALTMALILFLVGLREKHKRQNDPGSLNSNLNAIP